MATKNKSKEPKYLSPNQYPNVKEDNTTIPDLTNGRVVSQSPIGYSPVYTIMFPNDFSAGYLSTKSISYDPNTKEVYMDIDGKYTKLTNKDAIKTIADYIAQYDSNKPFLSQNYIVNGVNVGGTNTPINLQNTTSRVVSNKQGGTLNEYGKFFSQFAGVTSNDLEQFKCGGKTKKVKKGSCGVKASDGTKVEIDKCGKKVK